MIANLIPNLNKVLEIHQPCKQNKTQANLIFLLKSHKCQKKTNQPMQNKVNLKRNKLLKVLE